LVRSKRNYVTYQDVIRFVRHGIDSGTFETAFCAAARKQATDFRVFMAWSPAATKFFEQRFDGEGFN